MVSLINFKIVNEELQQQQEQDIQVESRYQQVAVAIQDHQMHQKQRAATTVNENNNNNQASAPMSKKSSQCNEQQQLQPCVCAPKASESTICVHKSQQKPRNSSCQQQTQQHNQPQQQQLKNNHGDKSSHHSLVSLNHQHRSPTIFNHLPPPNAHSQTSLLESGHSGPNFVVTWRNLKFSIEPKWHQRIANASPVAALTGRGRNEVSNTNSRSSCQQQISSPQVPATKIVLDKLDGSFKSGELTAILGPSGAGKTTLLDCLTGHRKHGLSGSIKISSSSSSLSSAPTPSVAFSKFTHPHHQPHQLLSNYNRHHHSKDGGISYSGQQQQQEEQESSLANNKHLNLVVNGGQPRATATSTGGDNLKVSIIPQNDHLMGHLTVYETLNYASKMKNCFDKQFNHKLNVRRVAQQLGLMSCLATRINKLSGGQYKRVSIAQELLSSPDILILDEPTSGLDAMTCYQTVQVLKKLTDDRQANGQNQIAVILTIHQPNSDVFQQFNHVYVVAQGGKCIYEGPPTSIESVINRVGIRLPNSYYNPATMIVEIAAGKFGLEAVNKLNSIQKKQYEFVVPDEQNSTGDSAVDCPSSSSNEEDDNDDEMDQTAGKGPANLASRQHQDEDDNNNNNNNSALCRLQINSAGGMVNKGFVMDNDHDGKAQESATNNAGKVVIVVVAKGVAALQDSDSVDKIKMNNESMANDNDGRRKKRRRTRKRSGEPANNANSLIPGDRATAPHHDTSSAAAICAAYVSSGDSSTGRSAVSSGGGGSGNGGGSSGSGGGGGSGSAREKRLKLNSLKADQKFPFWRHTYLHFHRSWLSIVRDPMLCSMQLALHIIVPVMVSLVYGTNVGKPNACPRAGPMDIMAYALEPTDSALQLQEDLRTTLENIGYIFFKLYGIIFAAMTVTVLTFPLDMHVLVKEFRNGWYGLSSYFLGRTLADIPFQLTLPLLAMSLSYYATGQPYSYMQWRFLSITGILILSSLIAQSQGLLFGAILMDKMKAAVFVAPAATTPIILFAGFLVRTQSIPRYLRPLSNLSYLRYAIEACLISRYGFNQCECDPATFNQTVPELPPIARSMLDYWLSSFMASSSGNDQGTSSTTGNGALDSVTETTTLATSIAEKPDLFTKLIDSLGKANSFGRNITSCEQVVPYPMIDYDLKDSQLFNCFAILLFMLVFTRLLTFFIVCFKVKRKV